MEMKVMEITKKVQEYCTIHDIGKEDFQFLLSNNKKLLIELSNPKYHTFYLSTNKLVELNRDKEELFYDFQLIF